MLLLEWSLLRRLRRWHQQQQLCSLSTRSREQRTGTTATSTNMVTLFLRLCRCRHRQYRRRHPRLPHSPLLLPPSLGATTRTTIMMMMTRSTSMLPPSTTDSDSSLLARHIWKKGKEAKRRKPERTLYAYSLTYNYKPFKNAPNSKQLPFFHRSRWFQNAKMASIFYNNLCLILLFIIWPAENKICTKHWHCDYFSGNNESTINNLESIVNYLIVLINFTTGEWNDVGLLPRKIQYFYIYKSLVDS